MEKETLEEAAKKYAENKSSAEVFQEAHIIDFKSGANWQAKRMYSEEEVLKLVDGAFHMYASSHRHDAKAWLTEQFKKK